jgi:AcrR family transcriptional regulator
VSDVKPGRRERYAAQTRAAVLAAARSLFVAGGFDATSVEDIARRSESSKGAETSKGAVYHHFSDKREIFAEVFRDSQATVLRTTLDSMADTGRPWRDLAAATRAYLDGYVADDGARALLRQAIGVLGWDRVRAIDEEAAFPALRGILEELVRTGQARPVPLTAAGELIFGLFCNAVLFIAAQDADTAGAASRDVEAVVSALLSGLRPDSATGIEPGGQQPSGPAAGTVSG